MIWLVAVATGTAHFAMVYPDYFLNSFDAVRTTSFDFGAPILFLGILIGGNVGVTIFATVALMRRRVTDRLMLCLLMVASLHDFASCLRWGSNAYYFMPTLAALIIIASGGIDLTLKWMRSIRVIPQLAAGGALALVLALGFLLAPQLVADPWDRRSLHKLHSIDGPILTDTAELNLIDAQPNLQWIDLMVLTSMEQLGSFDDTSLLDAISRRRIGAFALDADGVAREFRGRPLFWPGLRRAIEANYEPLPALGPPYLMIRKWSPTRSDMQIPTRTAARETPTQRPRSRAIP
jgi:hypothetical protein